MIAAQDCNIAESAQYGDPGSSRFFMRVAFDAPAALSVDGFKAAFRGVADHYSMDWEVVDFTVRPRVLILVSQMDHCLNDLLYRHRIGQLRMDIVGVGSNHQTARRRVESEGIAFHYWPVTSETRSAQETELLRMITREDISLVVLARYMQVLSSDLCTHLKGRAINIHHSFLPSFKGAKPYHRAHERGVKVIGATAHYVTIDLDEGPIIEQDVGRVDHAMSVEEFVSMGRDIEALVLARAVRYHIERRVLLNGNRTVVFR